MTEELTAFLIAGSGLLLPTFLVFLRIGAVIFAMPVFGEMLVPLRVRLAAAFAFTAIVAPSVVPDLQQTLSSDRSILLVGFSEVVTGLAIGLSLRLVLMALQIAATIAAQSTSLSQLLGNAAVDPQPAIGFILLLAALALASEVGFHTQAAAMLIVSYDLVLAGEPIGGADMAVWITRAVSASFSLAFVLSAPFIAVSLLYNLALGVINRAMPQLMVAFVGAPAITLGALVLLALVAPLILWVWIGHFQQQLSAPFVVR